MSQGKVAFQPRVVDPRRGIDCGAAGLTMGAPAPAAIADQSVQGR
jgi:hypothetical protein